MTANWFRRGLVAAVFIVAYLIALLDLAAGHQNMALDSVSNFVQVQASAGYSSSVTSITLQSGQGAKLPAAPFNLIWWNSTDYPIPGSAPTSRSSV